MDARYVPPLEQALLDIAAAELDGEVDDELREQVHRLLDETDLDHGDAVPPWLVLFFRALADRQTLPVTELPATGEDQGEVWELFAALQDIAAFDCYDYGEWVRVRLPRLGMLGLVSIEHSYFRAIPLAEVADVPSDLLDAKTLTP